jgi:hypothetical protein
VNALPALPSFFGNHAWATLILATTAELLSQITLHLKSSKQPQQANVVPFAIYICNTEKKSALLAPHK